jgi:hypothetical protein
MILSTLVSMIAIYGGQTKKSAPKKVSKPAVVVAKEVDYTVPMGTSKLFHQRVVDVQAALNAKDFVTATAKANLLPRSDFTYSIVTKNLSEEQKEDFINAIEFAAERWRVGFGSDAKFSRVTNDKATIVFNFEPVLAKLPESELVAGASWFFGTDADKPNLEAVLGLKRDSPLRSVLGQEVYNEALSAFGAYFGLTKINPINSAMARYDGKSPGFNSITATESITVRKTMELSRNLRLAAKNRIPVPVSQPSLYIEKTSVVFADALQGDNAEVAMTIANNGKTRLLVRAFGDCACISGSTDEYIEPNKTAVLRGRYDTKEIIGSVAHNIVLISNDPDRPVISIPATIQVSARAEFIFPESTVADLSTSSKPFEFYLHTVEPNITDIKGVQIVGFPTETIVTRFKGAVKDFKTGNSREVTGFKFSINLAKVDLVNLYGRLGGSVDIMTTNPKMPKCRTVFYVQKGIIVMPENVYMGQLSGPFETEFVISRPSKPFKILKMTCPSLSLSFESKSTQNDSEYIVKVLYNGKALDHSINTVLTIETNDPAQPTIKVPIRTNI